jgi:hypothetical protein
MALFSLLGLDVDGMLAGQKMCNRELLMNALNCDSIICVYVKNGIRTDTGGFTVAAEFVGS